MEQNLLDRMLGAYQREKTPVTITLRNRVRVQGRIRAFDSYVIVMDNPKRDILYRHAVSCLAPSAPEELKQPAPFRPARSSDARSENRPAREKTAPKTPDRRQDVSAPQGNRSGHADGEVSINSGMKEGLLRWMQVQKASKWK